MQGIGLIRASIAIPLVAFLEHFGAPVQRLVHDAGLPAWALSDPEALIPTSSTVRLLTAAARHTELASLGLLAGQQARIETLGTYGCLIRRSPTLGGALDQLVRHHQAFTSGVRVRLAVQGDNVRLCYAFSTKFAPVDAGWQQADHYTLMLMLGVVRLAAGPTWRPAEVRFQTGEATGPRDSEALSGAQLAFAQPVTSISLPRELVDAPMPSPPAALEIADESLGMWKASAPARDFVRSIIQVVEMLSWNGYPAIQLTASVLGMRVRTLQRYLAAAGVSHELLVGRARFATAAALLKETDSKVLDIALDLGYSDHAHFTRAFRRWAGCSPQEFRRSQSKGRRTSEQPILQ